MILFLSIITYLLIINILAFISFGSDKAKSKASKWRIPEKKLLLVAFLGGALGAWIGMRHFHHKTLHWRFRILIPLAFFLWLFPTLSLVEVFCLQSGPIYFSPLMVRRPIEAFIDGKPYIHRYEWVDYNQISPNLVRAVIASEDNLFPSHNGFSERGIRQAIAERVETGKVRHGGSTISQQTAKNVFTFGHRTIFRKIRETWYTVLIETFWSKQRIMEVYLNVIEMGDGIYGAEAASTRYFHHSAKTLSRSESALIAVCLPNPRKYSVSRPGPYVRRRQTQILNLMPKLGPISLDPQP